LAIEYYQLAKLLSFEFSANNPTSKSLSFAELIPTTQLEIHSPFES
jgi:hypothetical protein